MQRKQLHFRPPYHIWVVGGKIEMPCKCFDIEQHVPSLNPFVIVMDKLKVGLQINSNLLSFNLSTTNFQQVDMSVNDFSWADLDASSVISLNAEATDFAFSIGERNGDLVHCARQNCPISTGIINEFRTYSPALGEWWWREGKIGKIMLMVERRIFNFNLITVHHYWEKQHIWLWKQARHHWNNSVVCWEWIN